MFNKIYFKLKEFMKKNYKEIIFLIIFYLIITFPLPYYIYAGGGTINIDDRIEISNSKNNKTGSLNFAYVKELKGNVASFIIGNIIPWYDVEKEEESKLNENESSEDILFRNKIYLNSANQTAIMLAYNKASKDIKIKDAHFYIIYVDEKTKTGLKVGDEVIGVNGIKISDVSDYTEVVKKSEIGDVLNVTIIREDKEKEVKAVVKDNNGNKITGISISTIYDFETDPEIELKFKESESGPSGGLMLTLAIYNKLINKDLTNGLKIVGTGTIDSNGNVGEIGGVKYKLNGAVKSKADIFLVPSGDNYKEAVREKKKHNYNIEIKEIKTLDEAIYYLENLE